MRFWLVHTGEQTLLDPEARCFRYTLLARQLLARGHEVVQWAPTFAHATKSYRGRADRVVPVGPGYDIRLIHAGGYKRHIGPSRWLFYRRFAQRLRQLARDLPAPDVVVCGLPAPEVCLAALDAGRAAGARVVIDVQDLWPDIFLTLFPAAFRNPGRWLLAPLRRMNQRIFSGADAVTAVSHTYLAWGQAFCPTRDRTQDRVFPLAVEPTRLGKEELARERAKLEARGVDPALPTACFLGLFTRTIDLGTVLDAFHHLQRERGPPWQLVVCGDGPLNAALRARAKGLANCHFLGWCTTAQMTAVMDIADVGLAAYGRTALQSIPNKPLEYLAHGLALLSSLTGECAEVVAATGCGLSYAPGDAQTLKGYLSHVAADPALRADLRRRARATFAARFDPGRVYADMAGHLEAIGSRRASRTSAMRGPEFLPGRSPLPNRA